MYDTPEFLILFAPKCPVHIKRTVCKKSKSTLLNVPYIKDFLALNAKRTVCLIGTREYDYSGTKSLRKA